MCPKKKSRPLSEALGWSFPRYHDGKQSYVDFVAIDPATNTMRRKKYNVDRSLGKRERARRGAEICALLMQKLTGGWNPWVETGNMRGYIKFEEVTLCF
ncbi:MAG: hypothetical protein NC342_03195 [Pseudoflavonifractor sp.]|nr:hypothetical protein [Alloprevotella sp.]MCM1116520.1 hypothetical protein [Pseudoflavonifractor sp.]